MNHVRSGLATCCIAVVVVLATASVAAQELPPPPAQPPEVLRLLVENNALKTEVSQLRVTLARLTAELEVRQLSKERVEIETRVHAECPTCEIDWHRGTVIPATGDETP